MSQQYCILAFRKNEFRNNIFYPLKNKNNQKLILNHGKRIVRINRSGALREEKNN